MNRDNITLPRSVVERALATLRMYEPSVVKFGLTFKHGQDAIAAIRAALEQPQVNSPEIPEGWKLVPVEPTIQMQNAGWRIQPENDELLENLSTGATWAAMLAAAPQPPVVEQPQVEREPVAYATHDTEGSPSMLFFDRREAENYCDDHEEPTPLYTQPQNLNCKSTQARLATLWGYVKPQPKREPLTAERIFDLAEQFGEFRHGDAQGHKRIDFARAIERAHGIGGEA